MDLAREKDPVVVNVSNQVYNQAHSSYEGRGCAIVATVSQNSQENMLSRRLG